MIAPEAAKKAVDALRIPDWAERRKKELSQAGGGIRIAGHRLFAGRYRDGEPAGMSVGDISDSDRRKLFRILFPRLATWLERAWQLHARLPYLWGWDRLPFRIPRSPEETNVARAHWLSRFFQCMTGFDPDIEWLAAWAVHAGIQLHLESVGVVLGAAIDEGGAVGDTVFSTLCESGSGTHEIGGMGRHVVTGLLCTERREGWEFMGNLLLAAQRQEGLRQSILERVDESAPGAFRTMLGVVLENGLVRFSSVVRAADVWMGLEWGATSAAEVERILTRVRDFMDDEGARDRAISGEDGADLYYALWSLATEDVEEAIPRAAATLAHDRAQVRFAAALFLSRTRLLSGWEPLLPVVDDPDPRVAAVAIETFCDGYFTGKRDLPVFDGLDRNLDRFPTKREEPPALVWPWMRPAITKSDVAEAMVKNLGKLPVSRMLPAVKHLDAAGRFTLVMHVRGLKDLPADARAMLLDLAGDASEDVRGHAFLKLAHVRIEPEEARQLEGMLHRKAENLRRAVLQVLANQTEDHVLASAERLIAGKKSLQRQAGLELLRGLSEMSEWGGRCRIRAREFMSSREKIPRDEQVHLDAIFGEGEEEDASLENGLGLFDPAECAKIPDVGHRAVKVRTKAAVACLESLSALVVANQEESISGEYWRETTTEVLLADTKWIFPSPKDGRTHAEDRERLPLADLWEGWEADRPKKLREVDGFELVQALLLLDPTASGIGTGYRAMLRSMLFGRGKVEVPHREIVSKILFWLVRHAPPEALADRLLDLAEESLAAVDLRTSAWCGPNTICVNIMKFTERCRHLLPDHFANEQRVRFWQLLRWMEDREPSHTDRDYSSFHAPKLDHCLDAHRAGVATRADLYRQLFRNRIDSNPEARFDDLETLSRRSGRQYLERHPELREVFERTRDRVLEVELRRGDAPTPVSAAARSLGALPGVGRLIAVLTAMKRGKFQRGWDTGVGRYHVLSHLVRVSRPEEGDTPEAFAAAVREAKIPEKRLIELALYAPQWAEHVEHAAGWKGVADATWWIHAHTKGDNWAVDLEVREAWGATITERTPLTAEALQKGTVDVQWFLRVYKLLKRKRWLALMEAAKYASESGGHKRAELFADAMLGRLTKTALKERIEVKRHQDAVRAYGLLPLARGKARERDLLSRYQLMEEFIRTSREFGAQRQESEKLAVRVGQENLARTAGYADPLRLRWAMEREAVADLAAGPVTVSAADADISLSIDEFGEPQITVVKQGKTLKAVPAKARKVAAVKALRGRKTALKRQRSRIRIALEEMMIRGDEIDGPELRDLLGHPLIAPMFSSLVFMGDDLAGYPIKAGKALVDHSGKVEPVGKSDRLRIAHPQDLLAAGEWHAWQRDCFARERIQPFKQVFRELYPLTDAERPENATRRYAGHQVQPRQAIALLGTRGWVVKHEEGVRRTWHDEGITAYVEFEEGFTTPAEVEGLTVERVGFAKSGSYDLLPLAEIPPRLFSETMRDLDLMVSVAHAGGVDPEATASTVEMRTSLLRETLMVLRIENVRLKGNHALIDGALSSYSVHLGSAVVHLMPGGYLCIVPVHAQHRGRMFLPFADDDPRTAEVISKVLMLARDEDLKDPTILEQIRGRR